MFLAIHFSALLLRRQDYESTFTSFLYGVNTNASLDQCCTLQGQSSLKLVLFVIPLEKTNIYCFEVMLQQQDTLWLVSLQIVFCSSNVIHNQLWISYQRLSVVFKPSEKELLPSAASTFRVLLLSLTKSTYFHLLSPRRQRVQPPLRLMFKPDSNETRRISYTWSFFSSRQTSPT